MSKKLSSIPEYIQNKGNDRNNERTKKIQLFMCNHAPHPLFTFSEEKATQEVPSAVFRYPFQALRPWLSYHISSKYARYKWNSPDFWFGEFSMSEALCYLPPDSFKGSKCTAAHLTPLWWLIFLLPANDRHIRQTRLSDYMVSAHRLPVSYAKADNMSRQIRVR